MLTVEVAEDEAFRRVVAHAPAPVSAASDWTAACSSAASSPRASIGTASPTRTGTAAASAARSPRPPPDDPRPVNFAFVSCQNVNEGKLNAYRRMIFEDERAAPAEQLGFVLHLGDFIYEVVEYPEEVKTRYDRTIYEVARIPDGGKVGNFHFPLTVDGYRAVYKGYLADPDLQDARARWPFVAHVGQSRILLAGLAEHPAGRRHVAAGPDASRSPPTRPGSNIIPARVQAPSGHRSEQFEPPAVDERRDREVGRKRPRRSSPTT